MTLPLFQYNDFQLTAGEGVINQLVWADNQKVRRFHHVKENHLNHLLRHW